MRRLKWPPRRGDNCFRKKEGGACWLVALFLIISFEEPAPLQIDGYTDSVSYRSGDVLTGYLSSYRDRKAVLRLQDIGGKEVGGVFADLKRHYMQPDQPYAKGFGYPAAFKYKIPSLPSGIYLWEGKSPFIVRPSGPVDVVVVYASNTENAYNFLGGASAYLPFSPKLSFLRPREVERYSRPFFEWLLKKYGSAEHAEFSYGVISDVDLDDFSNIRQAKTLVIAGHSEYWTRQARKNFDRFVDEGGDAVLLSGNNMWWQVRYEENHTQMVGYKSTKKDPIKDPLLVTDHWYEPHLQYPILSSIGLSLSNGGYGFAKGHGTWFGYKIVHDGSPMLEGTGLKQGQLLPLITAEFDGAPVDGFDAAGNPNWNPGFFRSEVVGFDHAQGVGFARPPNLGMWVVFQKSETSGRVVNVGSTDWAGPRGMGGVNKELFQKITHNILVNSTQRKSLFVDPGQENPRQQ